MSLTGINCQVKLRCEDMIIGQCSAKMRNCYTNFDEFDLGVQIEHNQQSARFTCTNNNDCSTVSPITCATETTTTTTTTTTVTTSVPYCETTHITTPSPVISPTMCMCTPATLTTTVVTSAPQCETTHTTHSCKTTTIVCNSSSTATNINPLYTTSSIPIPTSANMYTSLTG